MSSSAWYCPICKKRYSNYNYFIQHHSHRSKIQCKLFYNQNCSSLPTGVYDPVAGPYRPIQLFTTAATNTGNPPPINPPTHENQQQGDDASRATYPGSGLEAPDDDASIQDDAPFQGNDDFSMDDVSLDGSQTSVESVDSAYNPDAAPFRATLEQFTRYKHEGDNKYSPLTPEFRAAIELMDILDKEGAPISAHEKIMEWHVKNSVCPTCDVTTQEKVTVKSLLKRLRERYNMEGLMYGTQG